MAYAIIRRATSCATRCRLATACCSITPTARSRASPVSRKSAVPPIPDATQFDKKSKYFDAKATQETPRWFNVEVQLVKKIALISIDELRQHPELENLRTLQRGNRLSITPVDPAEWKFITSRLARNP